MLKLFRKKSDSKDIALERLSKALIKDRTGTSPEMLENLGSDILSVISNYMEFDRDEAEIHISRPTPEDKPVLYAKIPIISLFDR